MFLEYYLLKYFKLVIVTGWIPQEAKKFEYKKREGMLLQSTAVGMRRDTTGQKEKLSTDASVHPTGVLRLGWSYSQKGDESL